MNHHVLPLMNAAPVPAAPSAAAGMLFTPLVTPFVTPLVTPLVTPDMPLLGVFKVIVFMLLSEHCLSMSRGRH